MFARKLLSIGGALVTVAALSLSSANSARACDTYCPVRKVVTYVWQEVPYEVCVTRYDHCGRPYEDYVTAYRSVQVPVVRWVRAY